MDTLARLFGNKVKVKVIRLFLFNQTNFFSVKDVSLKIKQTISETKKEILNLEKAGMLISKSSKKGTVWILNKSFEYNQALYNLLIETDVLSPKDFISAFKSSGKIKFILVSGLFLKEEGAAIDLIVVGDGLSTSKIEKVVENLEANVGRELAYAALETSDFQYRFNVYDKLVRESLSRPHKIILNRLPFDI